MCGFGDFAITNPYRSLARMLRATGDYKPSVLSHTLFFTVLAPAGTLSLPLQISLLYSVTFWNNTLAWYLETILRLFKQF